MKRIVAFDLGANLGVCDLIISTNGTPSIAHKVVHLKTKDFGKRLWEFENVLKRHTTFVTEIVVESPVGAHFTAIRPLFGYLGVLYKWAAQNNIEVFEYNPMAIKAFAARTGKAPKTEMIKAANRLMNVKTIKDSNEADAICLMFLHLHRKEILAKF